MASDQVSHVFNMEGLGDLRFPWTRLRQNISIQGAITSLKRKVELQPVNDFELLLCSCNLVLRCRPVWLLEGEGICGADSGCLDVLPLQYAYAICKVLSSDCASGHCVSAICINIIWLGTVAAFHSCKHRALVPRTVSPGWTTLQSCSRNL